MELIVGSFLKVVIFVPPADNLSRIATNYSAIRNTFSDYSPCPHDGAFTNTDSFNNNSGESNSFGAIVLEDPRITVRLTDITATISETSGSEQRLFLASGDGETDESYSESSSFYIGGEKTKVTFSGENAYLCHVYDSESVCQVSGGTYNIDVSEYLEPGLEYEIDDDGNFVIVTDQPANEPSYNPDVDDDLPPFIPTQPTEDDSVTIVACAAAAVVAALMAVFLILTNRKD